jgi:hypothetical protein
MHAQHGVALPIAAQRRSAELWTTWPLWTTGPLSAATRPGIASVGRGAASHQAGTKTGTLNRAKSRSKLATVAP